MAPMDDEGLDEIKRHFGVVADALRDDIRALADGQQALREELRGELTDFRREVHAEFDEVKAMIRFSYAELDRRVRSLETDISDLRSRVERLESRPSS